MKNYFVLCGGFFYVAILSRGVRPHLFWFKRFEPVKKEHKRNFLLKIQSISNTI